MVMTVTVEQIQLILDEGREELYSEGWLDLCSTNSRNRHVSMNAEVVDEEITEFQVHAGGGDKARGRVATLLDLEAAVLVFNYYASRSL